MFTYYRECCRCPNIHITLKSKIYIYVKGTQVKQQKLLVNECSSLGGFRRGSSFLLQTLPHHPLPVQLLVDDLSVKGVVLSYLLVLQLILVITTSIRKISK